MSEVEQLRELCAPIAALVAGLDLSDPARARAELEARFPFDGDAVRRIGAVLRQGIAARTVCDRENGAVRYSRVQKGAVSIDAVHMATPGLGHTHPKGEVDLCFPVDGDPRFCGQPAGWTVYAPGSWHVPQVAGGAMDILYFLPDGAIRFEERPT